MKQKGIIQIATQLANRLENKTKSFTASGRAALISVIEQQAVDINWDRIQTVLIAKILQKNPRLRKEPNELRYHDHIIEFELGDRDL
ncbi:MAG: hypothetical protein HYT98_05195 [Candidatus Sungbacteria bacterium]|nr:hypothetical protein [Candidatus Sungbacteria bacterium]